MVIFDTATRPFRGLRTYPASSSVPPGYFKEAKNIRVDTQAIALRLGQTSLKDNSSLSGTCLGASLVEFGSNTYYFTALSISGAVRIYYNVWNGASWANAVEVTASSGFFGNTRMVSPSTGLVSFTKVYSKTDGLCVVVQDGTSNPRVIKMSAIAAGNARKVSEVPAPQEIGGFTPEFGITDYMGVHEGSTATITGGSGTLAFTQTGTPSVWNFTTGAGAMVDNDFAQILAGSNPFTLDDARQVFVIAEVSSDAVFDCCKWELIGASADVTLHDPENGIDDVVSVETGTPGLRLYAFPIGEFAPSERVPGSGGAGTIGGLKITLTNTNVPVNATATIYAICTGGRVPGFAEYSQTWYSSGSMAESPEVVVKNKTWGQTHNGMFDGVATALPSDFKLPLSEILYYRVVMGILAPDQALIDAGVDYIRIYRRDPGEAKRTYVSQTQAGAYSSSWGYQSPFSASARRSVNVDIVAPEDKETERLAPDAFNEPVPIGQAALWASGKHYVGTYKASSTEPKSVVKVSEQDEPFRFASIPREDQFDTAFLAQFDGEEVVNGFLAVSASVLGSSSVYCFTNRGMYSIDGTLIRRLSSIGSIAQMSISENSNRMFWLDQNRSIRRASGVIDDISRLRIDDLLTGATATDKISSAFFRDRYYFAYSGGVLVWSELLQDWESLDVPGVQPTVFLPWRVGNESKLYFASSNGSLYQYEAGTTDASSQILIALTTQDIHSPDWERVTVGQSGIVCSDKDAETMTVTYTASNPTGTQAGTISLDAGGSETTVWRKDKRSTGSITGIKGASVNVRYSATIEGPFTIQSLTVNAGGSGHGRDT